MKDTTAVEELLASRYARALEGSRERADKQIAATLGWRLAVVRLEIAGDDGKWHALGESGPELIKALLIFQIDDVRYLGGGERVVQLPQIEHAEQLALQGHLERITRGAGYNFRMIAV